MWLGIGTTEKIFETKPQLYDVYVDNQNVTTSQPVLRDLLKITAADRNKLQTLENQRYCLSIAINDHINYNY